MISLIALLEIILKKERKTINVEYAECCGIIFEITCNTIKECEEKIKSLKIKEKIEKLEQLKEEQEKERQKALSLLNELFKKMEKEKEKNKDKKKKNFGPGF